ncbi:MAG: polysaccharide pyruvyl transferase family protein [Nitrosomonadales bacterium]|nr:polysaccharide pyruvyl transferase family protein [Nitrosomonadales bacterium]
MKIAVINALPDSLNPGMLSVDFALEHTLRNAGLDASIEYFSGEANYSLQYPDGKSRSWRTIESVNDLAQHDAIIYWGDFLHWIGYARGDWLKRQAIMYPQRPPAAALERYFRIMLEPDDAICEKIILFGGTLYPLNSADLLDTRYESALTRLLSKARLVKFRDMVSASYAAALTSRNLNYQGCDCAFLLDTRAIAPAAHAHANGYIGYSFGRTGESGPLVELAHEIGKAMGLPLVDVGWLDGNRQLAQKIALVKSAKFIITDVYHLSVTSLREGKPVFCIGAGSAHATATLSDKKKEFLFKQYLADNFYLFHEYVMQPGNFAPLVQQIAHLSENTRIQDKLFSIVNASAQRSRNELLSALRETS